MERKCAKKYCAVYNCLNTDCDPNLTSFELSKDTKRNCNISLKMSTVTPSSKQILCLSRKERLYIELPEAVSPNVLSGVQYLYKKYCKKTPGVIYNEPTGCEQETAVALFLQAVFKILDNKHVLILCDSSKLGVWTECLMKWMPDFDEVVAIDTPKLAAKKSVYITTTDRFATASYSWREWGIAVADDDFLLKFKSTSLFNLKAHYKIFISVDDIKEHLQKFSVIHNWLFPDMKVMVDQFKADKNNICDILEKRIWFAAFTEDFLFRTNNTLMPHKEIEVLEPLPRITRKNKDATGTKIKRTKRKVEDDNTESAIKKITTNMTEQNNSNQSAFKLDESNSTKNENISRQAEYNYRKDTSKFDVSNHSDDNMDIESFIRDSEPLKMDELKHIPDTFIDNMPLPSEKMDVTDINSALDGENSNDMKLNYSEDLDTDDAVYSLETQENGVENNGIESKENEAESITDTDIAANVEKRLEEKTEPEHFAVFSNANTKNNDANITKEKIDVNLNDDADFVEEKSKLDNETIHNGLNSESSNSKETRDDKNIESKDEIAPGVKENGVKKEATTSGDLDSKWEEMALKKFKGSLLDRIF